MTTPVRDAAIEAATDAVTRVLRDRNLIIRLVVRRRLAAAVVAAVWPLAADGEVAILRAQLAAVEQERDEARRLLLEHADRAADEADVRAAVACRIRAELVCCDVYDRDAGTDRAGRTHAICFWGEASARLAEGRSELAWET